MDLRHKVADGIAQVDEKLNLDDITVMDEAEKHHIQKLYRETLHQCYGFGFEVLYILDIAYLINHFSTTGLLRCDH